MINRTNKSETQDFTFRVTGKQSEIWNAVSGENARCERLSSDRCLYN